MRWSSRLLAFQLDCWPEKKKKKKSLRDRNCKKSPQISSKLQRSRFLSAKLIPVVHFLPSFNALCLYFPKCLRRGLSLILPSSLPSSLPRHRSFVLRQALTWGRTVVTISAQWYLPHFPIVLRSLPDILCFQLMDTCDEPRGVAAFTATFHKDFRKKGD